MRSIAVIALMCACSGVSPVTETRQAGLVEPGMIDDDPGDEEGTPWTLVQSNVGVANMEQATSAWLEAWDASAGAPNVSRGCQMYDSGSIYQRWVCVGYRSMCVYQFRHNSIYCTTF